MHGSFIAIAAAGVTVLAAAPAVAAPATGAGAPSARALHRTAGSWPVFRPGDANEGVRTLQYLIRGYQLGERPAATGAGIPVTGSFDTATEKAVTAFQGRRGLAKTGTVDSPVWNTINHDISTRPIGPGYPNSEFVKAAQNMVNRFSAKCGNQPLTLDGNYGPQTLAAVKKVQECQGLGSDGYVGPSTFPTLVANY